MLGARAAGRPAPQGVPTAAREGATVRSRRARTHRETRSPPVQLATAEAPGAGGGRGPEGHDGTRVGRPARADPRSRAVSRRWDALAEAGAPYAMPPRLTLRNGLSMQDEGAWRKAILEVTRGWRPFTVRLRQPEVVENRLLSLAPVGDGVADLQEALGRSLITAGFVPPRRRRRRAGAAAGGHVHRRHPIGAPRARQRGPRPDQVPDGLPRHHPLHGRRGRRRQRPADRRVPPRRLTASRLKAKLKAGSSAARYGAADRPTHAVHTTPLWSSVSPHPPIEEHTPCRR